MAETPYDRVSYTGFPFAETHPDNLAVLASLRGMSPAPAERCRLLELGCGDGGNLIPMAFHLPGSTFVGVDLSARAIEAGNATIAALGLKNIVLQHRDIAEVAADNDVYDYIVAHGVYSWVPQPVREKILDIFGRCLAPQGVAHVSYNALPGAHLRDLARSMMLFHVRGTTDDHQRTVHGRMLLDALAKASLPDHVYGIVLRDQQERVRDTPDYVLIHDDLDSNSRAFFLYEVLESAVRRGLKYLAEAVPFTNSRFLSDDARELLDRIPADDVVLREQYWDFVRGTAFRKTLLCRHDMPLRRPTVESVKDYYLTTDVRAIDGDIDPTSPDLVEFKSTSGDTLRTNHRVAKAAFVVLGRAWPQQFSLPELTEAARELIAQSGGKADPAEIASLPEAMFEAFETGLVQLRRLRREVPDVTEKPAASALARWQIQQSKFTTNMLHATVVIEDEIGRKFLPLIDGTRDIAQLADELSVISAQIPASQKNAEDPPINADTVRHKLEQLRRLGLLTA